MERQCTTLRALSISGIVCIFVACVSLAVAVATDHWQDTKVDRLGLMKIVQYKPELLTLINGNELYFDRTRGLFYRCGAVISKTKIVSKNACVGDMAFDDGVVLDFSLVNSTDSRNSLYRDLQLRNKLVISMAAILLAAILFTLITGLVGITATLKYHRTLFTTSVSFAFLATICAGVSMALFHGIDYLEKTKLKVYVFPAALYFDPEYNELRSHTSIKESYSYYLGWVGVFLSCVAAILFLHSRNKLEKTKNRPQAGTATSSSMSLFRESPMYSEKSQKSGKKKSIDSVGVNAYDMMETGQSTEGSELDSSRSPTSDGWSPYDELPSDDPIHK